MIVIVTLIAQTILIGGIAATVAPNVDELPHLASGLYHWETGRFDAYRVNPPLVRMWCTLPLVWCDDLPEWQRRSVATWQRIEWQLDDQILDQWSYDLIRRRLFIARMMNLAFGWLGCWCSYRLADAVYGSQRASLIALLLYASSPNLLAWHATLLPDGAAAGLAAAAIYQQLRWQDRWRWRDASLTGICHGLAILAKSTCLVLLAGTIFLAALRIRTAKPRSKIWVCEALGQIGMVLWTSWFVVNGGYGFTAVGRPLGQFSFQSKLFAGAACNQVDNRFRDTWLGGLWVPLPADFLVGIDMQRAEFERGKPSYFCGHWNDRGWSWYYLACLGLKVPCGTLALLAFSIWQTLRQPRCSCRDERVRCPVRRIRPPHSSRGFATCSFYFGLFIAVVSSQNGFSHHFRYLLPALPLLFVCAGRSGEPAVCNSWRRSPQFILVPLATFLTIASSLASWPRSHSFFSQLVGGTTHGYHYLLESNLDWGEDLDLAQQWASTHRSARPLCHAVLTTNVAQCMPIAWQPIESARLDQAGWYIVSIQRELDPRDVCYNRFPRSARVARLGSALNVYRVPERNLDQIQ